MEETCAIIKPEALHNCAGKIISRIEESRPQLYIENLRLTGFHRAIAEEFYKEHAKKDFFNAYIKHMISGPIIVMKLLGLDAVTYWRDMMGTTDPAKALPGTIRHDFGKRVDPYEVMLNMVHGSSSVKAAQRELAFFF